MGLRLVFILFAVVLAVWLVRRLLRKPTPPSKPAKTQDMLRCAHCGLHVPRSEAILDGDTPYCSPEHRDAGARR